jgi:hypothetical protein
MGFATGFKKRNADGVPSRLRHTRNHEMDGITRGCDAIFV